MTGKQAELKAFCLFLELTDPTGNALRNGIKVLKALMEGDFLTIRR